MFEITKNTRAILKQKLNNRERVFGGWVSYREPAIAETFAKAGLDFVAIDMEHTTITIDEASRIITGVQSEGVVCMPRPVSHNNDYIKPMLEAGADGMIIPMINTRAEAEEQVRLQKFPPLGQRSYGINRAHGYGFDFNPYINTWNNSGILVVQVESITAVENIEDLVKVPGIDAVMVGPYDISGSLGVPGDTDHPKVREATQSIIKVCANFGISCMTQIADVKKETIEDAFNQGYTSVILGSDLFILWKWAAEMRTLIGELR